MPNWPIRLRSFAPFLALVVVGCIGNVIHLPLFFGGDFLLGGIAVGILLQCYPRIWWGALAGAIVGSYTYILWGHPYACLIATLEAAFLAWQLQRGERNIAVADGWYWLLCGIPLALLFYGNILNLQTATALNLALQLACNGIFNAFVAGAIVQYWPRRTSQARHSLQQNLFNLLLAFAILPVLALTALNSWQAAELAEVQLQERLEVESASLDRDLRQWLDERTDAISQFGNLSPAVDLTSATFERSPAASFFPSAYAFDANGGIEVLATAPAATTPSPSACTAITVPTILSPDPEQPPDIAFAALAGDGRQLCGLVPLVELADHLRARAAIWGSDAFLLDATDREIVSSSLPAGESMTFPSIGNRRPRGETDTYFIWLPDATGMGPMERWRQAYYERETSLTAAVPWRLLLRRSPSSHLDRLEASANRRLGILLGFWGFALWGAGRLSRRAVVPLKRIAARANAASDLRAAESVRNNTPRSEGENWPPAQMDELAAFDTTLHRWQEQYARLQAEIARLEARLQEQAAALNASDARLQQLADTLEIAIGYIDRAGEYQGANHTHQTWLNETRGEVAGRTLAQVWGETVAADFAPQLARSLAGERVEFERSLGNRTARISLIPDPDSNGAIAGCYLLLTDISALERIEREARQAKDFLQTVTDALPLAIAIKDARPEQFGRYLLWNRASEQIFGTSAARALGHCDRDLFPDAGAALAANEGAIVASGQPVELSATEMAALTQGERHLRAMKVPLYDPTGAPQYLLCFAEDVTARIRAEAAHQESEDRLQNLIGATTDGLLVIDSNGRICFHNPAAERMFGRSTAELNGYNFGRTVPTDVDEFSEIEIVQPSGQFVFAQMRVVAIEWRGQPAFLASLTDVTQRHAAEVALRRREANYRGLIDNLDAGVIVYAPDTSIMLCNAKACALFGLPTTELLAKKVDDLPLFWCREDGSTLSPRDYPVNQVLKHRMPLRQFVFGIRHEDGESTWILANAFPEFDQGQQLQQVVVTCTDISSLKQAETQLRHAALHDALTGLPNRVLLEERLDRALRRASRHPDYWFAVLFVDLDRFKTINDSLGHQVGDLLLLEVSQRLQSIVRGTDTVCRLGGDEFVILLDGVCDAREVSHVAERIQDALRSLRQLEGREIATSASIGIALGQQGYSSAEEVLRDADTAMYRAKARGRACSEIFDRAMHEQVLERFQLETSLRRAIERDEFVLHFQPIVTLLERQILGFEALVRWQHPTRGQISPGTFIPLAEETGAILPLGRWVLETACQQAKYWQDRIPAAREIQMGVNVSARQLQEPNFLNTIDGILEQTGLAPECLKLEVTEGTLLKDIAVTIETLLALQERRVRVSIDDFGTGYSSLSYLKRFPVNTLKVDRSFVSGLGLLPEDDRIVEAIISLARTFKLDVVAEGVETELQLERLTAMHCHAVQGYWFAPPLAADEAERLLQSGQRSPGLGNPRQPQRHS